MREIAARDHVDQPRRGFVRLGLVRMGEQDTELVAADARHHVALAHAADQQPATSISASSPALWPKLSLIIFSPSRSTNSIAPTLAVAAGAVDEALELRA